MVCWVRGSQTCNLQPSPIEGEACRLHVRNVSRNVSRHVSNVADCNLQPVAYRARPPKVRAQRFAQRFKRCGLQPPTCDPSPIANVAPATCNPSPIGRGLQRLQEQRFKRSAQRFTQRFKHNICNVSTFNFPIQNQSTTHNLSTPFTFPYGVGWLMSWGK